MAVASAGLLAPGQLPHGMVPVAHGQALYKLPWEQGVRHLVVQGNYVGTNASGTA